MTDKDPHPLDPETDQLPYPPAAKYADAPTTDPPPDVPVLSWRYLTVCEDPDLVAIISTYFEGMAPTEPTDRLRSKLRLLPAEYYYTAQEAARAELDAYD